MVKVKGLSDGVVLLAQKDCRPPSNPTIHHNGTTRPPFSAALTASRMIRKRVIHFDSAHIQIPSPQRRGLEDLQNYRA